MKKWKYLDLIVYGYNLNLKTHYLLLNVVFCCNIFAHKLMKIAANYIVKINFIFKSQECECEYQLMSICIFSEEKEKKEICLYAELQLRKLICV